MKLILQRATEIQRDEDGRPWTWRSGEQIAEFKTGEEFIIYVDHHLNELKDAVAFTGSASMLVGANAYLGDRLKEAGII